MSGLPEVRRVRLHEFAFELPVDWVHFQDGSRLVFQSSTGIEVIVSGAEVLRVQPTQASHAVVVAELLENALRSIGAAAQHPELKTISALTEDSYKGHRRWLLRSTTIDEATLFQQAVFLGTKSVLLITFEAPNNDETRKQAQSLFDGIEVIPEAVTTVSGSA